MREETARPAGPATTSGLRVVLIWQASRNRPTGRDVFALRIRLGLKPMRDFGLGEHRNAS